MATIYNDSPMAGESRTRIPRGGGHEVHPFTGILNLSCGLWSVLLNQFLRTYGFAGRHVSILSLGCLFISAVSVHDAALVVTNHQVICQVEQNPIGRWVLEAQGGEVWLFVLLKLAGTALVCALVVTIHQRCTKLGTIVLGALAVFQSLLLCYLTLA